MAFTPDAIFLSPLLDGAERYAREASTTTPDPSIISQIGWNSTLLPEEYGGFGGTIVDLAAVIEGMAARAINLPLMTRCGVIPAMLNALPSNEVISELRTELAAGEACIEWGGPLRWNSRSDIPCAYKADCGSMTVTGVLEYAELTSECTHLMFAAFDTDARGILIALLETKNLEPTTPVHITVEGRNVSAIQLDQLPLNDADILATGATARHALTVGWQTAQATICADIVCTMNHALSETILYLQERKQFGQALAQFQVLRHEAAKLYVSFENSKGLLMSTLRLYTDEVVSRAEETEAAFDLLGLYVRQQAIEFAQSVVQLHGGMGMTRETLAARQATRLIALAFRFGDIHNHNKALRTYQGASPK